MLINGAATDPDGNSIVVEESEIAELLQQILDDHARKGDRSDTIICWVLTALSKLTIRLKNISVKAKDLIKQFTDHMNVEIQQRACEYLQLLDKKWDDDRHGIFEPIPIKSDLESKGRLFDAQEDRPDFDDNEGDEEPQPKANGLSKISSKAPASVTPASVSG